MDETKVRLESLKLDQRKIFENGMVDLLISSQAKFPEIFRFDEGRLLEMKNQVDFDICILTLTGRI